jgi:hypothetical protein
MQRPWTTGPSRASTTLKPIVDAAAAALLATGFFAFPMGLATLSPEIVLTSAEGGDAPVAYLDASLLAALAGPADDADQPGEIADAQPEPEPAAAEPTSEAPPAEAAADAPDPALASKAPAPPHKKVLQGASRAKAQPVAIQRNEPEAAGGRKSRNKKCANPDPRIDQLEDDRFAIDRDLVDAYTADLKSASRLAWVGWHRDASGEIDGFRVKQIRCGSVLHQAGFRNGDVIKSVNGKPVTTIPQALSAYRKLRKRRTLDIELDRRGEARKHRYKLT